MNIKIVKDGVMVSQATKSGYIFCKWGGCFDMSYPDSKFRRGRVQGGGDICPALTTSGENIVVVNNDDSNQPR